MTQRAPLLFTVAIVLSSYAVSAAAQVRPAGHGEVDRALARVRAEARREAPRSPFALELDRLARADADEFDRQYRRARRALYSDHDGASDRLLDAWDAVTIAWHGARDARSPQPIPSVPARGWLEFRGQIELVPVRVSGRTPHELYRECMDLVASSGIDSAREVWIEGQRVVRRRGAFGIDAACAMGVLNAVPAAGDSAPPAVSGALDGIPFAIRGTNEDARAVLRRYVPIAARGLHISRLEVQGQIYLQPGGWNAEDAVVWIDRALGGDGTRARYTVR